MSEVCVPTSLGRPIHYKGFIKTGDCLTLFVLLLFSIFQAASKSKDAQTSVSTCDNNMSEVCPPFFMKITSLERIHKGR